MHKTTPNLVTKPTKDWCSFERVGTLLKVVHFSEVLKFNIIDMLTSSKFQTLNPGNSLLFMMLASKQVLQKNYVPKHDFVYRVIVLLHFEHLQVTITLLQITKVAGLTISYSYLIHRTSTCISHHVPSHDIT